MSQAEPIVAAPVPWEPANSTAEVVRVSIGAHHRTLLLSPMAADLDVVSRPLASLVIAPGARARLYVSSPLWMAPALVADDPGALLPLGDAFAIERVRRTWFGRDTTRGELCYASRTRCRTDVDTVRAERRPWRAITPIAVHNAGSEPWRLEHVRLPVTALALYRAEDGHIWTPEIRTRRPSSGSDDELRVVDGSPPEAQGATQLARPREPDSASLLARLGSLFDAP